MNALHEEWSKYYLDRKAMGLAAGKSIEFVVGPDRTNGAPHGKTVRTYISLGDIMDQPRPVPAHGVHAAVECYVRDRWGAKEVPTKRQLAVLSTSRFLGG